MIAHNAERLYTRWHRAYEVMIRATGHERALAEYFVSRSLPRKGMRILDAGCGTGAVTRALVSAAARQGAADLRLYGFDLTEAMLQRFRDRAKTSGMAVSLARADVLGAPQALPPGWPRFDLVVSAGMLEYLPRDRFVEALARLRECLAPGGAAEIFISRPGPSGFFIKHFWRANLYGKEELERAFSSAGFASVAITPFQRWGCAVSAS